VRKLLVLASIGLAGLAALVAIAQAPDLREILATEAALGEADFTEPQALAADPEPESDPFAWLSPWGEPHARAEMLLLYADLATRVDQPSDRWPPERYGWRRTLLPALADPGSTMGVLRSIMAPNLIDLANRDQAVRAERALAEAALALASGEAYRESAQVAFSGESIRPTRLADGRVELSLRSAAEKLRAQAMRYDDPHEPRRRSFELQAERMIWHLPPPDPASTNAAPESS